MSLKAVKANKNRILYDDGYIVVLLPEKVNALLRNL